MSVMRLEIERREPVLNGAAFGAAGPYEKIVGMLRFEVDPGLSVHETIADLEPATSHSPLASAHTLPQSRRRASEALRDRSDRSAS